MFRSVCSQAAAGRAESRFEITAKLAAIASMFMLMGITLAGVFAYFG